MHLVQLQNEAQAESEKQLSEAHVICTPTSALPSLRPLKRSVPPTLPPSITLRRVRALNNKAVCGFSFLEIEHDYTIARDSNVWAPATQFSGLHNSTDRQGNKNVDSRLSDAQSLIHNDSLAVTWHLTASWYAALSNSVCSQNLRASTMALGWPLCLPNVEAHVFFLALAIVAEFQPAISWRLLKGAFTTISLVLSEDSSSHTAI